VHFDPPKQYQPNWNSINSRPLPSWYDEAKLGIMVVWGIYSVPSWGNWSAFTYSPDAAWYWHRLMYPDTDDYNTYNFHQKTYGDLITYQDFVEEFTGEMWDPKKMADIIASSGAKYTVITSKYHDGFCLWPSAQSWNWNSVDIGPQRDLVAEFAAAIRATNVTFGIYHSLYEWFNPIYLEDKENEGRTQTYIDEVLMPQLMDLVNTYQPEIVWSDGDWEQNSTYWKSTDFLAWLYNESPVRNTVVENDRWGYDCRGKNGGFWTPSDDFNPGHLLGHKWENSYTISTTYGFNRHEDLAQFQTPQELIYAFVSAVSLGGNMILGVGPMRDGNIPVILQERLLQLGNWLAINGDAIYSTSPWKYQNDTAECDVWFTVHNPYVYAIFFIWPDNGVLTLYHPQPSEVATITILGGNGQNLKWLYHDGELQVTLPPLTIALGSQPAWALTMQGVS